MTQLNLISFLLKECTYKRGTFSSQIHSLWLQWLMTLKQTVGSSHPKTAISLSARLKDRMRTLSLEVSVHLTSSICESMKKKVDFSETLNLKIGRRGRKKPICFQKYFTLKQFLNSRNTKIVTVNISIKTLYSVYNKRKYHTFNKQIFFKIIFKDTL